MEQFEFRNGFEQRLSELRRLLAEGQENGLDLNFVLEKIERVQQTLQDGIVKIVLLGSFSDGKTSAIAGLLGRLESDMKIDADESSDEIVVYRPAGLKKGFVIVDTPGLFGTKEKEEEGKTVKFSEKTEKFISEAHIIIYVCDAVTPLKDSHASIIERVLRTYNKLDSTIFVINKMDAVCDVLSEKDYARLKKTKSDFLVSRLRTIINLTPDEEKRLHIVCIAADPKGKGLTYWFEKSEDYLRRSHIGKLRDCINKVVEESDTKLLESETADVSVKDILTNVGQLIEDRSMPIKAALVKMENQMRDLDSDVKLAKNELCSSRIDLTNRLNQLKDDVISDINGASLETIGNIISSKIGMEGEQVTFYVFLQNINNIISDCAEANSNTLSPVVMKMEQTFSMQEAMMKDAMKIGGEQLKNFRITGEQVKAIRDVIAKGFKFKPWGAIKLANNITKWVGRVGAGLTIGLELYDWYKQYKDAKKLAELKNALSSAVNKIIKEVFDSAKDDDTYFKNYTPTYIDLCQKLKERNNKIEELQRRIDSLNQYKDKIEKFALGDIETVEYEEVKQ